MINLIIIAVLIWPFHHHKRPAPEVESPLDSHYISRDSRPLRCIQNNQATFFFYKDGAWGVSTLSCDEAIVDWQKTPAIKLAFENTL